MGPLLVRGTQAGNNTDVKSVPELERCQPNFPKLSTSVIPRAATRPPCVLQLWQMSKTLTVRFPDDMIEWLRETSRRTGIPVGRLVRDKLEAAKQQSGQQRFMRHAGTIKGGPPDLSSRKGFSRE